MQNTHGLVYVLSSPSGGGKTTLRSELLSALPSLYYSVSSTTRQARPGEIDGQDYSFVSSDDFKKAIEKDSFLEFAQVYDHFYGTLKNPIESALQNGQDVLLDLDPQGAMKAKNVLNAVLIYILPPSLESLKTRLIKRDSDPEDEILKRLAEARNELTFIEQYDYAVVNDRLDHTLKKLLAIMEAEKYRTINQKKLLDLLHQGIYKV